MDEHDWLARQFDEHRAHLRAVGEQLKEGVFGSTADEIDPRVKMLQLWIGMCGV